MNNAANNSVTSGYIFKGDQNERRARLIAGAREDEARLVAGIAAGWDLHDDLALVQARLVAWGAK